MGVEPLTGVLNEFPLKGVFIWSSKEFWNEFYVEGGGQGLSLISYLELYLMYMCFV